MATSYVFVANHVFSDNDGEMCIVGFADDESNPSKFVIIQKLLAPTESERAMRLGGVHLQVEDESRSAYDAIESVQIEADRGQNFTATRGEGDPENRQRHQHRLQSSCIRKIDLRAEEDVRA